MRALTQSQGEQIIVLEGRLDELKSELKREIKEMGADRAEIVFKFELADVSKFLQAKASERHSDRFWCKSLQWSIVVRWTLGKKKDALKHLSVSLHCHNDSTAKWSCKTSFNLVLFSQLPEKDNLIRQFTHDFETKGEWGLMHFISCAELLDEKNGYIKDDKIVLGVELKAEPVIREN